MRKVPAHQAEPLVVHLAAQLPERLQAVLRQVVPQPAVQLRVRQVVQQEQLLGLLVRPLEQQGQPAPLRLLLLPLAL